MTQLIRYSCKVATFFDLLGTRENGMTDALAYALSRSPALLRGLVSDLCVTDRVKPSQCFRPFLQLFVILVK